MEKWKLLQEHNLTPTQTPLKLQLFLNLKHIGQYSDIIDPLFRNSNSDIELLGIYCDPETQFILSLMEKKLSGSINYWVLFTKEMLKKISIVIPASLMSW